MKTIFIAVSGHAEPGDDLRLYYTTPKGGRTDVAHVAKADSDLITIARDLADQINLNWHGDTFKAVARGSTVILTVDSAGNDYTFKVDYPTRRGTIELGVDDTSA